MGGKKIDGSWKRITNKKLQTLYDEADVTAN